MPHNMHECCLQLVHLVVTLHCPGLLDMVLLLVLTASFLVLVQVAFDHGNGFWWVLLQLLQS